MATDLLTQLLPLLLYRPMPAGTTPLVGRLNGSSQPRRHRPSLHRPSTFTRLTPVVSEAEQVERVRFRLAVSHTTGVRRETEVNQPRLLRVNRQPVFPESSRKQLHDLECILRVRRQASCSQSRSIRWFSDVKPSSADCFASLAIRCRFVDTSSFLRLLSICRVSRQRSLIPTSRFPPPGPLRLCVPRLQRYYQGAMTPWSPSRFTSFPSIGDTIAAHDLDFALEAIVCVPCIEPGTCSPGNSVPGSTDGEIRASQVPGEPHLLVCTCSRDPGRTGVPDHSRNVRAAPAS